MNDQLKAYHQAFSMAVSDVMITMTGFEMEEDMDFQGELCCGGEDDPQPCEITGAMILMGQNSGMASITMTRQTASILVSYMTGVPYYELEDADLYDGIAELMNLIAGRAKAALRDSEYYYEITPPFTIVGENHQIVHKKQAHLIQKRFITSDLSFILRVFQIK